MELYWKIAAASVLTGFLTAVLSRDNRAAALTVTLSAGVVILSAGIGLVSSVRTGLSELTELAGITGETVGCVIKVCLIAALTQLCEAFCRESGAHAIGKAAELCGGVAALYVSMPLITSVWSVLKQLLGG